MSHTTFTDAASAIAFCESARKLAEDKATNAETIERIAADARELFHLPLASQSGVTESLCHAVASLCHRKKKLRASYCKPSNDLLALLNAAIPAASSSLIDAICTMLHILSANEETSAALGEAGVIELVVPLLGAEATLSSASALEQICAFISNLCLRTPANRDRCDKVGVVHLLLAAARSPLVAVAAPPATLLAPMARAMRSLVDDDSCRYDLVDSGLVDLMLRWLPQPGAAADEATFSLLREIGFMAHDVAMDGIVRGRMNGLVAPLMAWLCWADLPVHPEETEAVAAALRNIASDNEEAQACCTTMTAVAPALATLLRAPAIAASPDAVTHLCGVVQNYAGYGTNRSVMLEAGIAEALVATLAPSADTFAPQETTEAVLGAMQNLAASNPGSHRFADAGAIEVLTRLLCSPAGAATAEIMAYLFTTIKNICVPPVFRQRFRTEPVAVALTGLLSNPVALNNVDSAKGLFVLVRMLNSECPEMYAFFAKAGVAATVAPILRSDIAALPDLVVAACRMVQALAANEGGAKALGEADVVKALVEVMRHEGYEDDEELCGIFQETVGALCSCQENVAKFAEEGIQVSSE